MQVAKSAAIQLVLMMMLVVVSAAQEKPVNSANLPDAPGVRVAEVAAIGAQHTDDSRTFAAWKVSDGSYLSVATRPEAKKPRVVDKKFIFLNTLHLGLALADTEMTQACIADHKCREGNPLMPSSHAGQLAVDFGFFVYATGTSYWFKKHHSGLWWLPAAGASAAHTAGLITGLLHR